jgi:membrane-bound lytic murein transglycosylase C
MRIPERLLSLLVLAFSLCALLVPSRTLSQVDDLEREFLQGAKQMEKEYRDFEKAAFEEYERGVRAMWNDFVTSTQKDWVEYSTDKTGRSMVDFEKGEVVVQVLVPEEEAKRNPNEVKEKLAKEIERLAVDHGKMRDYPLPQEALRDEPTPSPSAGGEIPSPPLLSYPVLENQLSDRKGNPVTEKNTKQFAQEVLSAEPVSKEEIQSEKGKMVKAQVRFALIPNHLRIRAEKHLSRVRKNSGRFDVEIPLAFAVIHTESYFNPKATSPVPAYGLMQLVPKSGGLDAYRFVHGVNKVPSADYLYDPDNNVELGIAYLRLLRENYFSGVKDPQNALYCAIAAYNTGPGNLSSAFTGDKKLAPAIERINRLKPDELFSHLRGHLPYPETRDYLKRVSERMSLYEEWR